MTLVVKQLEKKYGKTPAVEAVSFTLQPETIYGLLGRNGAGKSTVLNMISHRIEKNAGEITLDGVDLWTTPSAMEQVYLSSTEDWFPLEYKLGKLLKMYQQVYPDFDMAFAEELVKVFGLDMKKKVLSLSTGYKSIAKLILALCVPANYVLLDEPVLGLDANHRQLFNKKLLEAYARRPRTFVIATHLIEEVAYLLEEVIVIRDGVSIQQASVEQILQEASLVTGSREVMEAFVADKQVLHEEILGNQVQAVVMGRFQTEIPATIEVSRLNLQDYFIQLTRKEGE